MKKTALTFGLFSLVMVATSFVTPEAISISMSQNSSINEIDGGQGRVTRKSDDYAFINDIDGGQGRVTRKSDDYAYNDIDGGQGRVTRKSDDYTSSVNTLAFEGQVTKSTVKVD